MNERLKELAKQATLPACHASHPKALERFAKLIRADEREACAKLCEAEMNRAYQEEAKFLPQGNNDLLRIAQGASYCVNVIRARMYYEP
jgi:hypothetical protein